jgi:hypothetical protein
MGFLVGGSGASKVYVGTTPVQTIYFGGDKVWPTQVDEPPYLYAVDVEYLPGYVVNFTARKGLPESEEEAFMFRCVQMPRDGYTARTFSKTWAANGYGELNCSLADLYGDGVPANNAEMMKTVEFTIQPRP